ncbi:conserved protein of unknown function [Ectopseudomonas oleovorans]|uniref:Uncharacterized protein n=1 Tax=Ectopseudomonas oleovorans TaxID=301 RepID=A0A653B4Z3_ECTOL|nr:conserved protein of unknown function [Pseudomonas oleovorans]
MQRLGAGRQAFGIAQQADVEAVALPVPGLAPGLLGEPLLHVRGDRLIDLDGRLIRSGHGREWPQREEEKQRRAGGKSLSAFPLGAAPMRKEGDAKALDRS